MKKIGLILALIAIATVSCEKLDIRPDYEKGKNEFNFRSGEETDTDVDATIVDPNQDEDEDIELEIVDPNNDEDEDKED